jgi:hypothetical protein
MEARGTQMDRTQRKVVSKVRLEHDRTLMK